MSDIIAANEFLPDWTQDFETKRDPVERLRSWVELFKEVYRAADVLAKTAFVPKEMAGKPADVAAAVMKGFELGMDPLDALASVFVIHGRVGFYAEFQRRRIIQAGHTFRILESTENRCTVEGIRREGGDAHRATFTAEQARKAGIDLGRYPTEKLVARATSRLCKQAFPDVLSGTLIAEDLIDGLIPADDTPAAPKRMQRRRAVAPPAAANTQPAPAPTPQPPDDEGDEGIDELLGAPPPNHRPAPATDQNADLVFTAQRPRHDPATLSPASADLSQPGPTGPTPDEPPSAPMNRKMHAIFNQLGLTNREDRLIITSAIIGTDITTSANLTRNEAARLIDTLEQWTADGVAEQRITDAINTWITAQEENGGMQ
jgi:hypothetical protein